MTNNALTVQELQCAKIYKTKLYLFNLLLVPIMIFLIFFLVRFYAELVNTKNIISIVIFIILITVIFAITLLLNIYAFTMKSNTALAKYEKCVNKINEKQNKVVTNSNTTNLEENNKNIDAETTEQLNQNYYNLNSLKFLDCAISFDFTNNLFCLVNSDKVSSLYKISDIISFDVLNANLLIYRGIKNHKLAGLLTYHENKAINQIKENGLVLSDWQIVVYLKDKSQTKLNLKCADISMAKQNSSMLEAVIYNTIKK